MKADSIMYKYHDMKDRYDKKDRISDTVFLGGMISVFHVAYDQCSANERTNQCERGKA